MAAILSAFGNNPVGAAGGQLSGTYPNPGLATPLAVPGGISTAASAPAIASPGYASGTASQLSDLTRDYMVYIVIATGGGTVTLAIGPTNTPANTLVNGAVGVAGTMLAVRVPAGWYLKITLVTSTIGSQIAIGC